MRVYLDSSAVVKLVQRERESDALLRWLDAHRTDGLATCSLAGVEVVRAVWAGGPAAVDHARRQLHRLDQIQLTAALLDRAAGLAPGTLLRSLDAIHLAAAQIMGDELRSVVTYDGRMADAATSLGLTVDTPS